MARLRRFLGTDKFYFRVKIFKLFTGPGVIT